MNTVGTEKLGLINMAAHGKCGQYATLLIMVLGLALGGCDKGSEQVNSATPAASTSASAAPAIAPSVTAPATLAHVRVGYIGLTCEAPLFVAKEKGYFKDEGIDAELVKFDWGSYRDALGLGRFDITHHLVMYLLKPVEQGLDVKFIAGVHRGCLRIQSGINSDIKSVADLKGKRIGVPALGTPPHVFAMRVLANNQIDPTKDVTFRVFPAPELGLALTKGEVDAVASADPIGTLLLSQGKVQNVVDQANDAPYKDEYCCAVVANGKFVREHAAVAAAATRAILRAAKWVDANPAAAAHVSVDSKYVAVPLDLDARALSNLKYIPSVSGARQAVLLASTQMKSAGMLGSSTDPNALAEQAVQTLDGVTDAWIEGLKVEKVAGGDILPAMEPTTLAALSPLPSCCSAGH